MEFPQLSEVPGVYWVYCSFTFLLYLHRQVWYIEDLINEDFSFVFHSPEEISFTTRLK